MSVTRSSLIAVDSPASKGDLWAQAAYLMANWQDGLNVKSAWQTVIEKARGGGETRTGIVTKPARTFAATLTAMNEADSIRLASIFRRMNSANTPMPIGSDAGRLAITAEIGETALTVDDAALRRFKAGGWALACSGPGGGAAYADFELLQVTGTAGDVVSVVATAKKWVAGDTIIPVAEAFLNLALKSQLITGNCSDAALEFQEVDGSAALDPLADPGSATPDILSDLVFVDDYPVWPFQIDWGGGIAEDSVRSGKAGASGEGKVVDLTGGGPLLNFGLQLSFFTRLEAWRFLTFFDWRGGMLYPFLIPNPSMRLPALTAINASDAVFARHVLSDEDWAWMKYLALTKNDLTSIIRRVTGVVHSGGDTTLAIDGDWGGLTLPNVFKMTSAHVVRFGSDEVSEDWITGECMGSSVQFEEIENEGDVEITNLETPATGTIFVEGVDEMTTIKYTLKSDSGNWLVYKDNVLQSGLTVAREVADDTPQTVTVGTLPARAVIFGTVLKNATAFAYASPSMTPTLVLKVAMAGEYYANSGNLDPTIASGDAQLVCGGYYGLIGQGGYACENFAAKDVSITLTPDAGDNLADLEEGNIVDVWLTYYQATAATAP